MNQRYDVIVVGGGNGGLSAAAYMAKAGKKVLLLEKHNLPGGCATSFVRGRFEFEATLHELCQMGETGAVRQLLNDYGLDVDWVAVPEAFTSESTNPDNSFSVFMPVGVKEFIDAMEKAVPGSRASMESVMEMCRMCADGVEWLAKYHNEPEGIHKVEMLLKWGDLMKLVPATVEEVLNRVNMPKKAQEIFETYWDYIATPSKEMSFAVYGFMLYTYLTQKPWIARMRSHEISLAFDAVIRGYGGDIWYNTEVAKIDVRDGKARGVELKDGTYIACDYVICNLMPNVVFDRMVDPQEVPRRDRQMMNTRRIAQCCLTVYIGLDETVEKLGLTGYDTFVRTTGDNEKQYQNSMTLDSQEMVYTVIGNVIPDCTPEGTGMIQFSMFFAGDAFKDVKLEDYFKVKDQLAMKFIKLYEQHTGVNLHDHIEEITVATPETWARYLGTPRGDVYGYTPAGWDGMFARVMSGHKIDHTIDGLRFVGGHGTQMDGYSQAYMSGAEQARYALLEMEKK